MEQRQDLNPPAAPLLDDPEEAYRAALAGISRVRLAGALLLAAAATPAALVGALLMLRSRYPSVWHLALLLAGLGVVTGSAALMRREKVPHPEWGGTLLHALLSSALAVYFVPFYNWWIRLPSNPYLAVNVALMTLVVFLALTRLTKAVHLLGQAFEEETLRLEGLAGTWVTLLCGAIFGLWMLVSVASYYSQFGLGVFPFFLLREWGVAMILPFALCTSVLLKAARRAWVRLSPEALKEASCP